MTNSNYNGDSYITDTFEDFIQELHYRLSYDPETGELRWKRPRKAQMKPGDLAGFHRKRLGHRYIKIGKDEYPITHVIWAMSYGYLPARVYRVDRDRSNYRLQNLQI